jgi:hypothetical protein
MTTARDLAVASRPDAQTGAGADGSGQEREDPAAPVPGGPGATSHRGVALAVSACAYLALAVVVWWNVWTTHPTTVTTCGCGDSSLFTWFLAWPAYALAHGLDPLYSTAMLHPTGVNLLANTSEVGLGVVLAPVTWIFGPVATFNVALTLSPALSALAMFMLVRRWVTWAPAAFVAGLLYGFSPFVLVSLTDGHLMLGLAVFPPLMVACLDELLFRQRRRPVVVGVTLGVLVFLQFLVGTEVLTIMVMTGCLALVLVAVWWLRTPSAHRARVRSAGTALVAAAVAAGVLLAYPVWFVLAGPAHYSGSVWPSSVLGGGGTRLRDYVDAAPSSEALVRLLHQIGGYQGASLSNQYLGIGLVAVLVLGLAIWHRDRRLWLLAAIGVVSVVLSFDRRTSVWVPWRVLSHVPLIQNIIPVRFVTVTYLVAAAMLGIVVDHTRRAVAAGEWREGGVGPTPPSGPTLRSSPARRWAAGASALGVAAVALVPVGSYLSQLVPMTTQPVILPTWFATVAPRLPAHQVLLAFPAPFTVDTVEPLQSAMTWQAVDRMHYAMVGAGGPAARVTPPGVERRGQAVVTEISGSFSVSSITRGDVLTLRRALAAWGVTAVVLPDQPRLPVYEQVPSVTDTATVLTAAIGSPPVRQASAWVWHDVAGAPAEPSAAAGRLVGCTSGVPANGSTAAVVRATACVVGRT